MAIAVYDASVVIAFLKPDDAHHTLAAEAFRRHGADSSVNTLLPSSVYAEVLVHPERAGPEAADRVRRFCTSHFRIEPLSVTIAEAAARLRAQFDGLRLPDALVIATAQTIGADELLTADRRWKQFWDGVMVLGDA